jgi:glycolate oxidase FAD binding subunit
MLEPKTVGELAEALGEAGAHGSTVSLAGNSSKRLMAGPREPADRSITTAGLRRVLVYEPRDLTISVEAGLPWAELVRTVAAHGQMLPLDPPFGEKATVGGVISANCSGPRRRLHGTARDFVIGMKFATMEGKLVQSGGMVVKNVAGLDMARLMIGSFGTLAAVAVVNFKLAPAPEIDRTTLLHFDSAAEAIAARDCILDSALQPAAIDLLNPASAALVGYDSWILAVRAGGTAAAAERYEREFSGLGDYLSLEGAAHEDFWRSVEEFTPRYLEGRPEGAVVRVSCTLKLVQDVLASLSGPAVARAGSGVCYGYFDSCEAASAWMADAARRGWKAVIEFSPEARKPQLDLWSCPGRDFELMRRIKGLFDPANLLNRGRLYGRI